MEPGKMREGYAVAVAVAVNERAERWARELAEAGFRLVGAAKSLDEAANMCLAAPVDAVMADLPVYERDGSGFAARMNRLTPLFRPAVAAVTEEFPRTVIRVEYGRVVEEREVFDENEILGAVGRAAALRYEERPEGVGERDLRCFLRELGVAEYTDGFENLVYALGAEGPWEMAKELYARLAARERTGVSNVERSMRYAIASGRRARSGLWRLCAPEARGNIQVVNALLGVLDGHVSAGRKKFSKKA